MERKLIGSALAALVTISAIPVEGQKRNQAAHYLDPVPFRVADKYGYSDRKKKLIIPAKYDGAGTFVNGRAYVWRDRKCGYIDPTGREVVPVKYSECRPFSDGLAVVLLGNWGAVDRTGRIVIPLKYNSISGFENGVAAVKIKGRQAAGLLTSEDTQEAVIDKTGRLLVPYGKFMNIEWYSDGLAHFYTSFINQPASNRSGFIDNKGRVVFDAGSYYCSYCFFSEGLVAVRKGGNDETEKWGFINKSGQVAIPFKFRYAKNFSDGLAAVADEKGDVYFIDRLGRKKIALNREDYESASTNELRSFSEGLAAIPKKGKGWGFIDKSGKMVIAPKYSGVMARGFQQGLIEVFTSKGNRFYIDKNGTEYFAQTK